MTTGSLKRLEGPLGPLVLRWTRDCLPFRRALAARTESSLILLAAAAFFIAAPVPGLARADGGSSVTISSRGKIGPLRLDRTGRAAIIAFAGRPDVEASGAAYEGGPEWDALGYRCTASDTSGTYRAPVAYSGPYCRTVFYLSGQIGRLATFFTSSSRYRDGAGVRVRMPPPERHDAQESRQSLAVVLGSSCRPRGLPCTSQSPRERRLGSGRILAVGGHVAALVLHSARHDVGVFDCL